MLSAHVTTRRSFPGPLFPLGHTTQAPSNVYSPVNVERLPRQISQVLHSPWMADDDILVDGRASKSFQTRKRSRRRRRLMEWVIKKGVFLSQPIRGYGGASLARQGGPGAAPAENKFGAFLASQNSSAGTMTAPFVLKVPPSWDM